MKLNKVHLELFAEYCEYEVQNYQEFLENVGNQLQDPGYRFIESKINSFKEVAQHIRHRIDE